MRRILIVDDDKDTLSQVNKVILNAIEHFDVTMRTDWGTAVMDDIESTAAFDLIITDFHIPRGKEGLAVIEAGRKKSAGTKIILMSGDMTETDLKRASPDAQLNKPFSDKDLIELLEMLLSDIRFNNDQPVAS